MKSIKSLSNVPEKASAYFENITFLKQSLGKERKL